MKTQSILLRVMALLLILILGIVACQKDDVDQMIPQEETLRWDIPDLPDDFARHFTEAQLTAFRAGPERHSTANAEKKAPAKWHPIIIEGEDWVTSAFVSLDDNDCDQLPTADDFCEYGTPPQCPGPITGVYARSEGEGIWKGVGKVTESVSGVICSADGQFYQEEFFICKKESCIRAYGDDVKLLLPEDGSNEDISYWEITFTEGTGKFEGAYGSCLLVIYNFYPSNPFSGEQGYNEFYGLGWVYY